MRGEKGKRGGEEGEKGKRERGREKRKRGGEEEEHVMDWSVGTFRLLIWNFVGLFRPTTPGNRERRMYNIILTV